MYDTDPSQHVTLGRKPPAAEDCSRCVMTLSWLRKIGCAEDLFEKGFLTRKECAQTLVNRLTTTQNYKWKNLVPRPIAKMCIHNEHMSFASPVRR